MSVGLWGIAVTFVVLFVLRVPIFVVLLAASIVGLLLAPDPIPFTTLPSTLWGGLNHFLLLAVPFYIVMGDLALASGVTRRLVDAAKACVGHISGALAHVSITVNMILAGMSGSDLADAAATGRLLIPAMRQAGYPAGYAASIIGGAAMIGPLVPPSLSFLLFGAATNVSIGRLFLAGAVPGVLLGLMLMLQAYVTAKRRGYPVEPRVPYAERAKVIARSLPVLLIPVVVLGSFFAGIATPTESAVLGIIAVVICGMFIYRELAIAELGDQLIATARTVGSIFMILAAAAVFGRILTLYGVAQMLSDWVVGVTSDPVLFLLAINVVYLVMGCFLDTVPIIIVFVPLLMPTVAKLGIDPVHFGCVTVFNLLIGLVTPPYGLTMFLLCKLTGIGMGEFWRYMWPIFLAMIVALLAITIFPQISLWLPNLLLPVR